MNVDPPTDRAQEGRPSREAEATLLPSGLNRLSLSAQKYVHDRPWLIVAICSLLTVASLLLMLRLRPEGSLQSLLDPTDPATAALETVLTRFPASEELLVMVSLPPTWVTTGRGDLTTSATVAAGADSVTSRPLLDFAARLEGAIATDSAARAAVRSIRYRPGADVRIFIENVVAPNGVLYLDDSNWKKLRERLTPAEMAKQFDRNRAMLSAPGPAAAGLAKALLHDPLRLREFLQQTLAERFPSGTGLSSTGYFSASGRDLLIRIEGTKPPSDLEFSQSITRLVTSLAGRCNSEKLELRISGAYPITAHSVKLIRHDSISNVISATLMLGGLFFLLYRRPVVIFLLALLPVAVGLVWGFGVYALLHPTVTPLAAVVGGVLGGIGIDYSMHMLTHHLQQRRQSKTPPDPWKTITYLRPALLAAWITSVLGFAAIAYSPVRVLRDFALIGSLGLIGVYLATVYLLPAVLNLLGGRFNQAGGMFRFPVATLLFRNIGFARGPVLFSCLSLFAVLAVATLLFGRPIRVESDTHALHPQPNPPLDAQHEISQRMKTSADSMLILVTAADSATLVKTSSVLRDRLSSATARQSGISGSMSLASLLPDPAVADLRRRDAAGVDVAEIKKNFLSAADAGGFDPAAFEGYAQFLERLLTPTADPTVDDLRQYPELANLLLPADRAGPSAALCYIFVDGSVSKTGGADRLVGVLRSVTDGIAGATATGISVLSSATQQRVRHDLPILFGFAALGVVAYLCVHFRSWRGIALALTPTGGAVLFVLLYMRLTNTPLNLINLVLVPLLLGINLDYGVFAVPRDRRRPPGGRTFSATVSSMLVCAGSTMLGFGSLAFSSIPAVRSLGWLIVFGLLGCVTATLGIVWPVVLGWGVEEGVGGGSGRAVSPDAVGHDSRSTNKMPGQTGRSK